MTDEQHTGDPSYMDLWTQQGFKHLFEATEIGMGLAGPDSVILDANPAWCRMLGYTRAELKRMSISLTPMTF